MILKNCVDKLYSDLYLFIIMYTLNIIIKEIYNNY